MNFIRTKVSENRKRYTDKDVNLDLSYITDRIIAMSYPSEGVESFYRNSYAEVKKFLTSKHSNNYRVYNLRIEKLYDLKNFEQAANYLFYDHQAPPFSTLINFCKDAAEWLEKDENNVVAIHCKAGKGRTGTVIAALLLHIGIAKNADQAIEIYAKQRTKNMRGITIPSQLRYVYYYDFMLKNPNLYEVNKGISIKMVQFLMQGLPQSLKSGQPFILEISDQENKPIFQKSRNEMKTDHTDDMILIHTDEAPPLKNDYKISLYKVKNKILFSFWLNSAFVNMMNENVITLRKKDLDLAFNDTQCKRFPEDFNIGVTFSKDI